MNNDIIELVKTYQKDADSYLSNVQGLENYSEDEIKQIALSHLEDSISQYELDIQIVDLFIHGSRMRNDAREDSDLDIEVYYRGNFKEDSLFNILNDEDNRLFIEYIPVDFNPKKVSDIDSEADKQINAWKKKSNDYDLLKSVKMEGSELVFEFLKNDGSDENVRVDLKSLSTEETI